MYEINFIAYAIDLKNTGLYEDFLIPFTFFCLLFNKNSHVEIIVLDPNNFKKKYSREIESIKEINNNFLIRKPNYKLNNHIPNTYRFFEVPTVQSKYTYISDIDIMYMEIILPNYLKTWPQNLPYHNKVRPDTERLTGVIMVKNDEYYTDEFKQCQEKYYKKNKNLNDEYVLYHMCNEIHGLPDNSFNYRPIFGIHFSPNRGEGKRIELKVRKRYYAYFLNIANKYQDLFKYDIFNNLLNQLKNNFKIV
jgi:hypothetical protein